MTRFSIGLLSIFLSLSCQQSTTLSEENRLRVITEVRQMLTRYDEDVRKNGLPAEFKYLDNSPDFYWVPPGYTSPLSYDSVTAIIKENASLFTVVDNRWDTLTIYPLTNELASFTGKIKSSLTDNTGTVFNVNLIESGLVIKRKDGWKIRNGQTAILEERKIF